MPTVRSSAELWKPGGHYYRQSPDELLAKPILPDLSRVRDRRILAVFETYGDLRPGSRVLEIGCGRSAWLPHLACRMGCSVAGVDVEPFAARLAEANLSGAAASGEIVCRDAFVLANNADMRNRFDLVYSRGVIEHFDDAVDRLAIAAQYIRPGGRILTTVPNLRGLNWLLQRFGDRARLEMHVIYDNNRLVRVHEAAGYETVASGYIGFCDAYLTATTAAARSLRGWIHRQICRASGMCIEAWQRIGGGAITPELSWVAPHVFYVGRRKAGG
jgi:SAM-dependent methyltransferase